MFGKSFFISSLQFTGSACSSTHFIVLIYFGLISCALRKSPPSRRIDRTYTISPRIEGRSFVILSIEVLDKTEFLPTTAKYTLDNNIKELKLPG